MIAHLARAIAVILIWYAALALLDRCAGMLANPSLYAVPMLAILIVLCLAVAAVYAAAFFLTWLVMPHQVKGWIW